MILLLSDSIIFSSWNKMVEAWIYILLIFAIISELSSLIYLNLLSIKMLFNNISPKRINSIIFFFSR